MLTAQSGEALMRTVACVRTRRWITWAAVLFGSTTQTSGADEAPGVAPGSPASVLVAAGAKQPSVAVGPDGAIHVAMLLGGNVVVSTSTDGGASQGVPAFPVLALRPRRLVVAWESTGSGGERVVARVVSTSGR